MKAAILYFSREGRAGMDAERFCKMTGILENAGIEALCRPISSKFSLLEVIQAEAPDIVFSAESHIQDESGRRENIHAILESLGVAYVGSSPRALDLALSKAALKTRWQDRDVSTPDFYLACRLDAAKGIEDGLINSSIFPCVLKPNREGNSRGLDEDSIVFDHEARQRKLRELLREFDEVLVEEYLGNGENVREFTIAMIGNGEGQIIAPAEIILLQEKKHRIITTTDKDDHLTRALPVEDDLLRDRLIMFAREAFDAAGVRDYARLDVIMTGEQLSAIEINGQPMIPDRWFEICSAGAGLDSNQYIQAIFLAAIVRHNAEGGGHLDVPPEMEDVLPGEILDIITESAADTRVR